MHLTNNKQNKTKRITSTFDTEYYVIYGTRRESQIQWERAWSERFHIYVVLVFSGGIIYMITAALNGLQRRIKCVMKITRHLSKMIKDTFIVKSRRSHYQKEDEE